MWKVPMHCMLGLVMEDLVMEMGQILYSYLLRA